MFTTVERSGTKRRSPILLWVNTKSAYRLLDVEVT